MAKYKIGDRVLCPANSRKMSIWEVINIFPIGKPYGSHDDLQLYRVKKINNIEKGETTETTFPEHHMYNSLLEYGELQGVPKELIGISSEAMDEVQTTQENSPNVVVIRSYEDNSDKSTEDMKEFENFKKEVMNNEYKD